MTRDALAIVKQIAALLVGLLLLVYFLYHTMYGEKGYLTMQRLQGEVAKAGQNLQQVQDQRQTLEHRVQGLRPDSLDPDLLEEEARRQLGFTKPDERVILTPDSARPRSRQ